MGISSKIKKYALIAVFVLLVIISILLSRCAVSVSYDSADLFGVTQTSDIGEHEGFGYVDYSKREANVKVENRATSSVVLSSYYYGDYDKYYKDDLKAFINDDGLYGYISSLSGEFLSRVIDDIEDTKVFIGENDYDVVIAQNVYGVDDLWPEVFTDGVYKEVYVYDIMLIGVVDNRYYVYAYPDDTSVLVIQDMFNKRSALFDGAKEVSLLKKLGYTYTIDMPTVLSKYYNDNGVEIYITKG